MHTLRRSRPEGDNLDHKWNPLEGSLQKGWSVGSRTCTNTFTNSMTRTHTRKDKAPFYTRAQARIIRSSVIEPVPLSRYPNTREQRVPVITIRTLSMLHTHAQSYEQQSNVRMPLSYVHLTHTRSLSLSLSLSLSFSRSLYMYIYIYIYKYI